MLRAGYTLLPSVRAITGDYVKLFCEIPHDGGWKAPSPRDYGYITLRENYFMTLLFDTFVIQSIPQSELWRRAGSKSRARMMVLLKEQQSLEEERGFESTAVLWIGWENHGVNEEKQLWIMYSCCVHKTGRKRPFPSTFYCYTFFKTLQSVVSFFLHHTRGRTNPAASGVKGSY